MNDIIRSPFPYAGNKKRVLEKGLKAILHDAVGEDGLVWDMMTGSGVVLLNSRNGGYGYDIDPYVIIMHRFLQEHPDPVDQVLDIFNLFFRDGLTEDGYYALREEENRLFQKRAYSRHLRNYHAAILLILCQIGFNSLFRFGPKGFNTPYGHAQKQFDITRIAEATEVLKTAPVTFVNAGFKAFNWRQPKPQDVVYFDPPYYVSEGSHTYSHWSLSKEMALRGALAELDESNRRFVLSNVATYRGVKNTSLINFAEEAGFNIYSVPGVLYTSWAGVRGTDRGGMKKTREILVTNFEIGGFE